MTKLSERRGAAWAGRIARHNIYLIKLRLARIAEFVEGYVAFVRWIPRLAVSASLREFDGHEPEILDGALSVHNLVANLQTLYINLDHRADRNILTRKALSELQITEPTRIPGNLRSNGALGCAISHVYAIEALMQRDFDLAMICEDDIDFLFGRDRLEVLLASFAKIPKLGVLCLANRVRGPRLPINSELAISNNVQMAACYVVKPFALRPLHDSFSQSVNLLEAGVDLPTASIDQLWKETQTRVMYFAVPRKLFSVQRESFSDIAGRTKYYR